MWTTVLFLHTTMFSPIEYLNTLNQISLLNGLVTPALGLTKTAGTSASIPAGIPVVTTVPVAPEQCNDMISWLAGSGLSLKVAVIFATALIVAYLIKKYGKTVLTAIRSKIQHILSSIENKIRKQRSVYLLAPAQSVVLG